METKQAIEIMLKTAGAKKQDVAKFLNIAVPSFSLWLQKLNQVERLIKICKYCQCDIIITDHKNINIVLTLGNNKNKVLRGGEVACFAPVQENNKKE